MKRLIVDLDQTLTEGVCTDYAQARPNLPLIARLREYKEQGFEIVIHTSRNMRTHAGNLGKINATTLPLAIEWLRRHEVPFDEIYMAKPWCGHDGFYIDDRAVRPSEFITSSYEELMRLVNSGREGG
ncbi:MAG TPA: capsular biosynthesis protein [Ramlibacter sp.]|jgi:capsule biosynthesis phosphatase|nr:capsular biosynthesis protein [Ramlibacter sp.]